MANVLVAMLGRLLSIINERDKYQVALTIIGKAGTGKSSIVKLIRKIFSPYDTSIISCKTETTFGLSSHLNHRIVFLDEIGPDSKLPFTNVLSMVCGDPVEVPRKFKSAISVDFSGHCLVTGNRMPGWRDVLGNLKRRLCAVRFEHKPDQSEQRDDNLQERMMGAELGDTIVLLNRAYCSLLAEVERRSNGRNTLASVLPPYFELAREQLAAESNSLLSFLASNWVCYGDRAVCYMPARNFSDHYNDFCKDRKLRIVQDTQIIVRALDDVKCVRGQEPEFLDYPRPLHRQFTTSMATCSDIYIRGIDIRPWRHNNKQPIDRMCDGCVSHSARFLPIAEQSK